MNEIHKTIELFLKKYALQNPEFKYLVAFSGGYDSMCLLDILRKNTPNEIIAIHLNHKWRGEESDLEEENCERFCQSHNIKFYSEALGDDIAHTETAARDARYKFFERCAEKFNSQIVFTAHNKNDNVETLIYRICMGTGINGLQGICEHREIYYRPMLEVTRDEIELYCKQNNLTPNTDSSNKNTKYKRNKIREEILPKLFEINPNLLDSVTSLSEVAKEETQIINDYVADVKSKITKDKKYNTKDFLSLCEAVQKRLIYEIFLNNNLEYDRKKIFTAWKFIKENSNSKSGKTISLAQNLWLFTSAKFIEVITNRQEAQIEIAIEKEGKFNVGNRIFEIEKYTKAIESFPKDSDCEAFVFLDDFPYQLRARCDGDIIRPLGTKGTQKLKKYLNEKKISNHEKNELLFLAKGNEILWAAGLGISDKIKVSKTPTHKLKLYNREN